MNDEWKLILGVGLVVCSLEPAKRGAIEWIEVK